MTATAEAPAATETETKRKRTRIEYPAPVVTQTEDGKVQKGIGHVKFSALPAAFRKDANRQLRGHKIPAFGQTVRPWFFYTDLSVGTNEDGSPRAPGLFILFYVADENQLGDYQTVKALRSGPGNFIVMEFLSADIVSGKYSAEDWALIQTQVRQSLGLEKAQTVKKTRAPRIRWIRGFRVDASTKKDKNGNVSITFLDDGDYKDCKARVTPDCLAETSEESMLIEVPQFEVTKSVKVETYKPYEARVATDELDEL